MPDFSRSFHYSAIYIVQSLTSLDTEKTGYDLYRFLEPIAASNGVGCFFYDVVTKSDFLQAIQSIVEHCHSHGAGPILHLETHGSAQGIHTGDDELVSWAEIRGPLTELNQLSRMNLLVTMAACHGLNIVRTMNPTAQSPMWGLIGPDEIVLPSDIRRGFSAFFKTLIEELDLNEAIRALKEADHSWPDTWKFQNAELFLSIVYGRYLEELCTPAALAAREYAIVQTAIADGASKKQVSKLTKTIRRTFQNEERTFKRFRKRFLLLDLFPENEIRFQVNLAEVKRHAALRLANSETETPPPAA